MITHHDGKTRFGLAAFALALSLLPTVRAEAQNRMPPIPPEKMTEAQKKAAADYTAARGALSGPWVVFLRSPEVVNRARPLSDYLRFNSSLSPKISEFIVLITTREWSQAYAWNSHYVLAVKNGISPAIAAALGEGRRPEKMAADEEAAYDFCTELYANHSVSDATYAKAMAAFGEQGIIDMVGVQGWYTMVSMALNASRAPAPEKPASVITPFPQ